MIRTAVILVGGQGSRLGPLTEDTPKPLVEVGGRPILSWILEWLKGHGIEKVVFGCGDKEEDIRRFMEANSDFGLEAAYSENSLDGGTAEAFRLAIERHVDDDNFIAMNGDELTTLNMSRMMDGHMEDEPLVTMALAPLKCRFSVVRFDEDNVIKDYEYGPEIRDFPVSMGVYIFNKSLLSLIPDKGSIEQDLFKELATQDRMKAYMLSGDEEWTSVNNMKDIKVAEQKLREWGRL